MGITQHSPITLIIFTFYMRKTLTRNKLASLDIVCRRLAQRTHIRYAAVVIYSYSTATETGNHRIIHWEN